MKDETFKSAMYAATHKAAQVTRTAAFHECLARAKAELGVPLGTVSLQNDISKLTVI
jgi:hypothetical protein